MSDLGQALGYYIGGLIIVGIVGGAIVGATLVTVLPWLWHVIATHVSVTW